ncbi:hypothetical protein [Shewanella polaris]|uniref:Uncharacterized protein n=1 Tax=Shewanella polaris TaxID=2588449 RepID=A0A4Y5YJY7_9GAMM|nr:hypothetical protein [Shewanella polaris]QDE33081.1 hypothetical protein FH971_20165 [Shewanella polaris]
MLTPITRISTSLFIVLLTFPSKLLIAGELTDLITKEPNQHTQLTNDNASSLPPQHASDHLGKVIIVPEKPRSGLEYKSDDIYLKPSLKNQITKQTNNRSSRSTIANDPSCRWLDNRLKHLQKKLRQTKNNQFSHYQDEIDIRKREFTCLKCASTGPTDVDRSICQPKR